MVITGGQYRERQYVNIQAVQRWLSACICRPQQRKKGATLKDSEGELAIKTADNLLHLNEQQHDVCVSQNVPSDLGSKATGKRLKAFCVQGRYGGREVDEKKQLQGEQEMDARLTNHSEHRWTHSFKSHIVISLKGCHISDCFLLLTLPLICWGVGAGGKAAFVFREFLRMRISGFDVLIRKDRN